MSNDPTYALDVARGLAKDGIPLFLAFPADNVGTGFIPPKGWEKSEPDPSVVDRWNPDLALCAVMGHGLDVIDIDPRNGGSPDSVTECMPSSYGVVGTPSSGIHIYIKSLGVGKATNLFPGVDIQAGAPDGSGRGFVFLPPTVRKSRVSGEPKQYRWMDGPYLERWCDSQEDDHTGEKLRVKILERKSGKVVKSGGEDWWQKFATAQPPQSHLAANRAIADKIREVDAWNRESGEGFRTVLLRAAMTLGGYVGGGYIEEDYARSALWGAAGAVWGTVDSDDELWIHQGIEDGKAAPFTVYIEDNPLSPSGISEFIPMRGTSDQELAKSALNTLEPAVRLAQDAGLWVVADGDKWIEKRKEYVASMVSALGAIMPLGDPDLPKSKTEYTEDNWRAVLRSRFLTSGPSGAIERKILAVAGEGGSRHGVVMSDLDNDPEILWAGQHAWDLRASSDQPQYAQVPRDTPHMHTALIAPDPMVATPYWDAFVEAVLPDPEIREWTLRVLAIGLTGYADAALPILYGRERSGKTSLVEILMEVYGSYGRAANAGLLNPDYGGHDVIVYDLKGVRLAFIDEGPKRGHKSTERLKQITGGGSLTASQKGANPITFRPTHTLVLTTNIEPDLTDPALRARARIIPCNSAEAIVWPARQPLLDPSILRAEAPGILAQMMRFAALWLADRQSARMDSAPAAVLNATTELAESQDPVREWVNDCTIPTDPGTPGRRLYTTFAGWHQSHALHRRMSVPSETAFGRTLTDMGYPSTKMKDGRYRPLSVLNGPGYYPTPTPSEYLAERGAGFDQQSAGFGDGFGDEVGNPKKPSSNPVSSSLISGLPSLSSNEEKEEEKEGEETTEREAIGEKPGNPSQPVTTPPLSCENAVPGSAVSGFEHPSQPVNPGINPPLSPERSNAARIADEKGVTKTEARARLKEVARLEAIAEASGGDFGLPAVVDRAGRVRKVDPVGAEIILEACLQRSQGALTVDVETSGYPVGHNDFRLRTVQLGDDTDAVVLDPTHRQHAGVIVDALNRATTLHAHSASADLVPLARMGLVDLDTAWSKMHDTVIPAKLADPQSTGSDPGLKKLSVAVLGSEAVSALADDRREAVFKAGKWLKKTQADTPVERSGWAQIDSGCEAMLVYAASDVLDTAALAKRLPPVPPQVLSRERTTEEMTARVACHGLEIDYERVMELWAEHTTAQSWSGQRVMHFGIENPGSGPQVAAKLAQMGAQLPVSEKGNPSVAEHVLTSLRRSEGDVGALAGHVLDYRHATTVLNLFLSPYRLICERGDGRARPTIYSLGTDTGRMSCVRPNFQQLPRQGGIRSVVRADPGMCLVSADFSGVELRGAAALSQDPTMIHMIREEDGGRFDGFHWEVARQAFGPEATKADRYTAKRGVFGHIYGGGVATLARQVGVAEAEMAAIIDSLKSMTPGLAQWSDNMRQAVRQGHTQFPAYSGRVIHLPRDYPHKAPNYAIQGSCRELLVDALVRWRQTLWGKCTLLPIHDELIVQVPENDIIAATEALVSCMESELYGVKIVADPGPREEWGSAFWRDAG